MEISINKTLFIDIIETTIYNRITHFDVTCKVHFYNDEEKTILNTAKEVKLENLQQQDLDFNNIVNLVVTQL